MVSAADESESGEEFDPDSSEFYIEDPISLTDEELYMAAQLIYSEGAKQSSLSYWVMACVIYNRVASESFPDTVYEVTFQNNQFSYPDSDPDNSFTRSKRRGGRGRYQGICGRKVISAGRAVLQERLSFQSWGKRVYYCTIGGNMYYK